MAAQRIGAYFEVAPGVDIYYEDEGEGPPLVLIPSALQIDSPTQYVVVTGGTTSIDCGDRLTTVGG